MNAESLCSRVSSFGYFLLEKGYAQNANPHKVIKGPSHRKDVIWVRSSVSGNLVSACPARLVDYLALLRAGDFSFVLDDGSIVQIAYIFDGASVVRHRLLYYPCPLAIAPLDMIGYEGGLADFIEENFSERLDEYLLLRSPIRFDFDPGDARDYHPASHVTVNDPCCRIPVRSAMGYAMFVKFVLENFYPDIWGDSTVREALSFDEHELCLAAHDKARAHLTWT
ncbi:DUF2290 domain-containing protein [Rhizomicrobium electricum]|uniref:DUF2290 domain-containing protein n=1 Tax=Rhizomicrobium electricum TaxID=480070 RepID=A0ABN1FBC9_9PROT|nr:DUF2290 domain-containing protein [Rhizomicrobium electricum]NIJ50533.1 hypothetical protein [Rhizomicrobium electricum]